MSGAAAGAGRTAADLRRFPCLWPCPQALACSQRPCQGRGHPPPGLPACPPAGRPSPTHAAELCRVPVVPQRVLNLQAALQAPPALHGRTGTPAGRPVLDVARRRALRPAGLLRGGCLRGPLLRRGGRRGPHGTAAGADAAGADVAAAAKLAAGGQRRRGRSPGRGLGAAALQLLLQRATAATVQCGGGVGRVGGRTLKASERHALTAKSWRAGRRPAARRGSCTWVRPACPQPKAGAHTRARSAAPNAKPCVTPTPPFHACLLLSSCA